MSTDKTDEKIDQAAEKAKTVVEKTNTAVDHTREKVRDAGKSGGKRIGQAGDKVTKNLLS